MLSRRVPSAIAMVLFALLSGAWSARAADLAQATPEELKAVYAQLRQLHAGEQWGIAENVSLKRDAGTFNFRDGRLVFAAPVADRIVAAAFEGQGSFSLDPPTPIDQRQIARYTKSPRLEDQFRKAVFFFTDDTFAELKKIVMIRPSGAPPSDVITSIQKEFSESFNNWWSNRRQGNFQMRNLAARMLADLTDPSSRGFFLAVFKTDHVGDLVFHISWNRDSLLMPDLNNDEEVMLLHYYRSNYHEWVSGFHLAEEYARQARPQHRSLLVRCPRQTIEAEVTKDNHLEATSDLNYEVVAGTPRVLPMNLSGVLRISAVQDGAGRPLTFIQEARDRDSDPWIILPAAATPGPTGKMKITYAEESTHDSRIIHQLGSGLYYVGERQSWYPSFGASDDRTYFLLRFRSPKKFTFVATGRRLKADKEKDAYVSEWQSEIPYAVAGFNYGNFADKSQSDATLTVTVYGGKEIPDELRNLSAAIDVAELAGGPGGSKNIAGQLGIATGGFTTTRLLEYAASVTFQAMKLFEYYFGPLPFKAVAVTEQPVGFFGQSWPTLIYLPYTSLLDSTTRHGLRIDRSADAREFYNTVAVHEMAHQWWGHMVGWRTYHEQWLSEGLAEFSAALYLSKTEPKNLRAFWDLKRDRLLPLNSAGHRPVDVGPLWLGAQLPAHLEPELYQQLVYFKGAYVMEMLRSMMWDPRQKDPDAPFIAMMRDFVASYAAKNASTEDFRRVVEKHMGEPMGWFFDEWIYGTEVPSYDIKYQLKDAGNGKTTLSFAATQSGVSEKFRMRVPVFVWLNGQPRRLGQVDFVGNKTVNTDVNLPFKPEKVTLDEEHSILCHSRG